MKITFLALLLWTSSATCAQHCPWDCTGMLVVQTNIPETELQQLHPVLVDRDKNILIDTMYGTGKNTSDTCELLSYAAFQAYRIQRITLHYWYRYDTMYAFAKDRYLIKFNYCKYRDQDLFIRYTKNLGGETIVGYILVPAANRLHLHDYNRELISHNLARLQALTASAVLTLNCEKWGLKGKDCSDGKQQ